MWLNCMRFVSENGISVRELERRARTPTNLAGMQRWGYISVAPDPGDKRPKPPKNAWKVRATFAGRSAQQIWQPLAADIESLWRQRFGSGTIDRLQDALAQLASQLEIDLPDCMPILKYGLFSAPPDPRLRPLDETERPSAADLPLHALLAKVLLSFVIEFEREFPISLATCANLLRVLDENGARVRDLPSLSGVSKEAINMGTGILKKARLVAVGPDPSGGSAKIARLTARGIAAQTNYRHRLAVLEERWKERFGRANVANLRSVLEELVGDSAGPSRLLAGLEPDPDGWRARVRKPVTLPHFPMVLHRGGFPDGS